MPSCGAILTSRHLSCHSRSENAVDLKAVLGVLSQRQRFSRDLSLRHAEDWKPLLREFGAPTTGGHVKQVSKVN